MDRIILHSDINSCYAAIECFHNPDIRHLPVAVGGDEQTRHGIILAKNERARACGVKTAEPLWQARRKCPDLVIVPPNFELYTRYTDLVRQIYADYTPCQESFGLDESWLDVTGSRLGSGVEIADAIRGRVLDELGISVSVGVSWNKIFAKLGSDLHKPNRTTAITRENFQQIVWPLPAPQLLYVGPATERKLARVGIYTIGQLAQASPEQLHRMLGKMGLTLHAFANGRDASPVRMLGEASPIKSIGNSTTTPRDMSCEEDVKITLYVLCEHVAERLRAKGLLCTEIQLYLRDTQLSSVERQCRLDQPTALTTELYQAAMALFRQHHHWPTPLRSIGVRASRLMPEGDCTQTSLFPEDRQREKRERLERVMDETRRRYGSTSIRRGIVMTDEAFSTLAPKEDSAFVKGRV